MSKSIWNEISYLLEDSNEDDMTLDADDEDVSADTSDTGADDNSGSEDSTEQQDTSEEESQDDDNQLDPDEEGNEEPTGEEEPTGDDTGSEGEDTGEEGMGDEGTGEDLGDGSEPTEDSNDPSAKLKELEKSIFDQLSKEQKELKTKELKSLFDMVYNKCTDIINTISGADRSPEQAKIYDYVMNSLTDLQGYVKDYLFQIFDSKTYIENMVQLQKYLTVLDTVSSIFEEIKKSSSNENTSK